MSTAKLFTAEGVLLGNVTNLSLPALQADTTYRQSIETLQAELDKQYVAYGRTTSVDEQLGCVVSLTESVTNIVNKLMQVFIDSNDRNSVHTYIL